MSTLPDAPMDALRTQAHALVTTPGLAVDHPLPAELARVIDHTLLRPDATQAELEQLCAEARRHRFASVCVNGSRVALAARLLAGSESQPIAVVGFPLGACSTATKAFETREAVADGAAEIDMVINVGLLRDGQLRRVHDDIAAVVSAADGRPVKVILETALLTDEQKALGCLLAAAAGATFVKTCTGFGGGAASVEDIRLMRRAVGPALGVKASGGVRTRAQAEALLRAGATRIGASASVAICASGGPSPAEDGMY